MAAHIRSITLPVLSRFTRNFSWSHQSGPATYSKCWKPCAIIRTSSTKSGLMEFFDDPKHWGATEVKSGRSWTEDELRTKSNLDLQKLWYVLLKERNMLLTMEYNANNECELFPSPERLDKVEESMKRIEKVVHERNDAYWRLEIGEPAPKPREEFQLDENDPLAVLRNSIKAAGFDKITDRQTLKFQLQLQAKERKLLRKLQRLHCREALALLKRFPNLDKEALQDKYPDVNISKLLTNKKTLGHHEFNTA